MITPKFNNNSIPKYLGTIFCNEAKENKFANNVTLLKELERIKKLYQRYKLIRHIERGFSKYSHDRINEIFDFLSFNSGWSSFKGTKLAGDENIRRAALRRPLQDAAEDSGIDSDDEALRLRAQLDFEMLQLNETGSSDEELVLASPRPKWAKRRHEDQMLNESGSSDGELIVTSPMPKWSKRKYDDPMGNMEEGQLDRELLIPMLVWQRPQLDDSDTMLPGTPDRSSPPLFEVELTASDEDDDGSVLELVIPLQSSRYNSVNSSKPTTAYIVARLFCSIFCCFRD